MGSSRILRPSEGETVTRAAPRRLFVLVVLGAIARALGFSIVRFLRYIKDELLIVLGTSSSEGALPLLMAKLERLGCSKQVVGLVVPTG
jgi:aerobic C4-dicarboxylate transport protein